MQDFDALISEYRVAVPVTTTGWLVNRLAYSLGLVLLMAPFIRGLALPMAVFSLLYFFSVFLTLLAVDVGKIASRRLRMLATQIIPGRLPLLPLVRRFPGVWIQLWESFLRSGLALRRALALWETRFFSASSTSPNVFFSSPE